MISNLREFVHFSSNVFEKDTHSLDLLIHSNFYVDA